MAKTRRLKREMVIETAARMADEAGDVQQLTLAKLASALDIRTPSLYNHIKNLDDLHQALALWGLQKILDEMQKASLGKIGREALQAMAHLYRDFAHRHPGVYPLILRAPAPDDTAHQALSEQTVQTLLLLLASGGLKGDIALHAIRGLRSVMHGFVALEMAGGFGLDLSQDESYEFVINTYLDGLGI